MKLIKFMYYDKSNYQFTKLIAPGLITIGFKSLNAINWRIEPEKESHYCVFIQDKLGDYILTEHVSPIGRDKLINIYCAFLQNEHFNFFDINQYILKINNADGGDME